MTRGDFRRAPRLRPRRESQVVSANQFRSLQAPRRPLRPFGFKTLQQLCMSYCLSERADWVRRVATPIVSSVDVVGDGQTPPIVPWWLNPGSLTMRITTPVTLPTISAWEG